MTTANIILIAISLIGFGAILTMLFRNFREMKKDYNGIIQNEIDKRNK